MPRCLKDPFSLKNYCALWEYQNTSSCPLIYVSLKNCSYFSNIMFQSDFTSLKPILPNSANPIKQGSFKLSSKQWRSCWHRWRCTKKWASLHCYALWQWQSMVAGFQVGFPTGQDLLVLLDTWTDIPELSRGKGTPGKTSLNCPGTKGHQDNPKMLPRDRAGILTLCPLQNILEQDSRTCTEINVATF